MKKPMLYFSDVCPDTPSFVEILTNNNISYDEVNITASMPNLKQFLQLRDERTEFEFIKEQGRVGVPVLLLPDDTLVFELKHLENVSQQVFKDEPMDED